MHTWSWKTWDNLPYLTCSLLDRWPHGFFTQHFYAQPPQALTPILHPEATTYRVRQVHGNCVLSTRDLVPVSPQGELPPLAPADGLMTAAPQESVWVCTADCVPVLVADTQTGQVAAVHAGWRGTAAQILPQTIAQFQRQGSHLQDLRVALGPAIAGTVYQVATEVATAVGATLQPLLSRLDAPEATTNPLASLGQLPEPPIWPDPQPGRVRLDVRRVNVLQLEHLGFQPEQVAIAPYCTYQQPEYFFSYRRTGQKQVQWSGIISIGS
ncbi:peptidoglycan editing factor PgeF [Trichothermofontia sp.]